MKRDEENHGEIRFGPEIAPGVRRGLRRSPDGEVESIVCSPLSDGTPVHDGAEVAYVDTECKNGWHKVTSSYKSGPAQVATPAYREGYDRIFGKQKVGLA